MIFSNLVSVIPRGFPQHLCCAFILHQFHIVLYSWSSTASLIAPEDPCPSYYRYVINILACVLILVIFFCHYSPQGHLWSANHCVIHPPLICPPLYRFPGCAYGPSNPFDYPPPYPISESAEIIPIIAYPSHVRVDHFHVIFVSGKFKPGLLVQDNTWDGPLCVVRYVARGGGWRW